MARMIKQIVKVNEGFKLITVFENGTETERKFKIGDMIENLRYVADGEIKIVTGRLSAIKYTLAKKLAFNAAKPTNTLQEDVTVDALVLDTSEAFNSKSETVPALEIVEFEDETDVARMKYGFDLDIDIEMRYSDYKVQSTNIEIGDTFNNVKIMQPDKPGVDITGKFEMIAFAYTNTNNKLGITGMAFKDVNTGKATVALFENILALNEVYSHEIPDSSAIAEVIASLNDGDTLVLSNAIDTSAGKALNITKKDITLELKEDVTCDGSKTSGIRVTNGTATINGTGKVINNTPYSSTNSSGVIGVTGDGELTINNGGIKAVIDEDPANKGQFGICMYNNAKLTVNGGEYEVGWYCVAGNGSGTSANSVITINGGKFKSVADYTIYHPHPGKLVINGGEFEGAAGALAANNGDIEINGGSFAVLGGGDTGSWGDGTSGLTDVAINLNAKYGDITCRINDGKFYATPAGTIMIKTGTTHTVDLKIFGGKFTSKPEDAWIAEGCVCSAEKDSEGFYVVSKA